MDFVKICLASNISRDLGNLQALRSFAKNTEQASCSWLQVTKLPKSSRTVAQKSLCSLLAVLNSSRLGFSAGDDGRKRQGRK